MEVSRSMRFDADYFHPKHEKLTMLLKRYPAGWNTLGNLVNIKDTNFNPDNETEYKYIELANIGNNGEIISCMTRTGANLPTRARRKVTTGDVIVSSVEGSLDSIALITEEYDNALCSTGFYVIDSETLKPGILLALLKSKIGQLQLKRGCSGTILTAINKEEFRNIILPIVACAEQVEQLICDAFDLRKQAVQRYSKAQTLLLSELKISTGGGGMAIDLCQKLFRYTTRRTHRRRLFPAEV